MCGHFFFSFTSTKKYIYIKVSFVHPTIIINKNNILLKKKEKKMILKKKKDQMGFEPTVAHIVCIHSPTIYALGHVGSDYLRWQKKSMILGLLKPSSLIGDDRK